MRLVPFHAALDARSRDGGDEYPRRLDANGHQVRVGVQVREKLLSLVTGPDGGVAGASPSSTSL